MPDHLPEAADAVVIGAGIAGASCAFHHLAQRGPRVCVPEAGRLVAEEVVDGRAGCVDIGPLRSGRVSGDTGPGHRELVF